MRIALGIVALASIASCDLPTSSPDMQMNADGPSLAICMNLGAATGDSPTMIENGRAGTPDWNNINFAAPGTIEAYATATSVLPGETLSIRASSRAGATMLTWKLLRFGYYGGVGARVVGSGGPFAVSPQPIPAPLTSTGRIECAWPESAAIPIDPAAAPGLYLAQLSSPTGESIVVPFVVREPETRRAKLLVLIPSNTWQAYNDWGGTSLYGNVLPSFSRDHADEASYDRPYNQDIMTADLLSRDRLFALFVEGEGFDVGYATDADLDRDPCLVANRSLIAIEGHSEYWSQNMRASVEQAVAGGTSLASFSGNEIYWQVRLEPSSTGSDGRTVVCYKEDAPAFDPLYASHPAVATVAWRSPPVNRPENALLGVLFDAEHDFYTPLVIRDAGHWTLDGTNLANGAMIPGLFGYESDRTDDSAFQPRVSVIGDSTVVTRFGDTTAARMTIYDTPKGGFVVGGASVDWPHAIARPDVWDARAQRMVWNVLARAVGGSAFSPLGLPPGAQPPTYSPATVSTIFAGPPLVHPVAIAQLGGALYVTDDAGGQIYRVESGRASLFSSGFTFPSGIAAGADGALYVVDAGTNQIFRVAPDGTSNLLAGSGTQGYTDGNGASASFSIPLSICAGADGALYIGDGFNHALRKMDLGGTVSTVGKPGDVSRPSAVACAADRTIYVFDGDNYAIIPFLNGAARPWIAGQGRRGFLDGTSDVNLLGGGRGAAISGSNLVFAEGANASVRLYRNGTLTTLAGGATADLIDGPGASAGFSAPAGITALPDGSFAVADTGNAAIRRVVITP
jgi:hypothetical protein